MKINWVDDLGLNLHKLLNLSSIGMSLRLSRCGWTQLELNDVVRFHLGNLTCHPFDIHYDIHLGCHPLWHPFDIHYDIHLGWNPNWVDDVVGFQLAKPCLSLWKITSSINPNRVVHNDDLVTRPNITIYNMIMATLLVKLLFSLEQIFFDIFLTKKFGLFLGQFLLS
jgi:hypothetical protein